MSRTDHRSAAEPQSTKGLTGWHVLAALIAFFGVVFAVNGVFLTQALSTHTGIVSQEPYVKGLHYNARIAAGERQAALHWNETLAVGVDGRVEVTMTDAGGQPVRGLAISGAIGRPSTSKLDRTIVLAEVQPGRYAGVVGALETGTWLVNLEAKIGDAKVGEAAAEPVYRMRRRQWLKQ